ncbi:MAG TPA: sensor histidine kinase [Verrucomicrobiae bacterium]|nr:sensor histidine kinase [Verrucomicrobiae bacterium]
MSTIAAARNMTLAAVLQHRVGRWVLGFLFWTLLGLSFASQFYISGAKAGYDVTWKQAVTYALGDWYVFALLSIPVNSLARRFGFEAGKWGLSFCVHLLASIAFSLAYIVIRAGLGAWQSGAPFGEAFRPLLVKTWHFNLLIYWVIVAVSQAFGYYRKYRERELHASELEKHLVQAKLQALQMQLNPHFLFNTLHSISSLMHKDVEAADRMIMRLSDLLRAALDCADTQEVSLRKELELLELYLGIEQIRFGDRLSVKLDVAPDALEAQVPNFILQPLVENAIRHGIEPRAKPGRIELHASRQADALALTVSDNGKGIPETKPTREGVGLSNTRARLRELYGASHRFELRSGPEGGLRVEMTIPFRPECKFA